jgi:alpha-1,3-rhamnosyltransferase
MLPADPVPWVSILTPSYNYEEYVGSCLRSVNRQRNAHALQHIVIDDGSTDCSWEIVRELHPEAARDALVRPNRGLSATLNEALGRAQGQWVNWLNSDDLHLPWTLEVVEHVLQRVPDADLIVGDTVLVDSDTRYLRLVSRSGFDRAVLMGGFNPFFVSSTFWRRAHAEGWAFDETLQLLMDMDLWLNVTTAPCTVVKVDIPLSLFRSHNRQISARTRPSDSAEMRALGARHGIPALARSRTARSDARSRIRHAASRVVSGAAARELRLRGLRGRPVDWTTADFDQSALDRLAVHRRIPELHVTRVQ